MNPIGNRRISTVALASLALVIGLSSVQSQLVSAYPDQNAGTSERVVEILSQLNMTMGADGAEGADGSDGLGSADLSAGGAGGQGGVGGQGGAGGQGVDGADGADGADGLPSVVEEIQ
jgi:hypothetical protein